MTVIESSVDTVETGTPTDEARIIGTIVSAFVADPVIRWVYPEPHEYFTYAPEFARAFGGRSLDHASAYYVDAFAGAALWLPPGVAPDEEALGTLIQRTVEESRVPQIFAILEEMGRYHPTVPHWYLPLIGVDVTQQRRGYGSALMRHALERVDDDHLPAYLESSNPENISLYVRHGFEVMGTIHVAPAPPLFPMYREAL